MKKLMTLLMIVWAAAIITAQSPMGDYKGDPKKRPPLNEINSIPDVVDPSYGNNSDASRQLYDSHGASPQSASSPTTLLLSNNRYEVTVNWRNYTDGSSGIGNMVQLTRDSGYSWFSSAGNVDLVIKVLDGRQVNGCFWVISGALTDLEYSLKVRDLETGAEKIYYNPAHKRASYADIQAFPVPGLAQYGNIAGDEYERLAALQLSHPNENSPNKPGPPPRPESLASCGASDTKLCLNQSRFNLQVSWRNYTDGKSGLGHAVPVNGDSGYFWFFENSNVELMIKVLDGKNINGCFWVMYGALTNVEYTITVTDTLTGAVKTYLNPSRNLASAADMQAFLWSQPTPLSAAFTYSPTSPLAGQTVQFTDTSSGNPTHWSWNFGDGSTSIAQNPSHIYATSGNYSVSLTTGNSGGNSSKNLTIIIGGGTFVLNADVGVNGGTLPAEYTCDGAGSSPALSWSNAPAGTVEFALLMTTLPGDGTTKWNWVLYRIPASTTKLVKNSTGVGILGAGSDGPTMAYQPPCSQGPGAKIYTFTLYALSGTPQLPSATNQITGAVLYQAISNITLGSASLSLSYSRNSDTAPTPGGKGFSIAETISDQAQSTTLAFSGLAMMTGNLEAQSFFPPGKVSDYTGFQYLRDNDPSDMGHNTSFLTRIANNVIYILNDTQFSQLKTLATSQLEQINLYGYKRFPLMKAFRRLLDGTVPSGSLGLNLNAVKKASRELYILDGQISFDRALLYANLIKSLDSQQVAYLEAMKGKGWSSWPDITDDQIRGRMQGLPQGTAVAVMTYASDLFSWYAGSVEADVYFCPERQGTYYGSFYIKDAPAIGHEGYGINEQLTATAGSALCDSSKGYVSAEQAAIVSSLVDQQRANLYASPTSSIVKARTEIATLLRSLLTSTAVISAVQAQVLEWSGIYGDLDGENNYYYATVFAQVYKTLTTSQKAKLSDLRKSIMSGTYSDGTAFDFSICTTPFLYSSVITDLSLISSYLTNTDYLFFEP